MAMLLLLCLLSAPSFQIPQQRHLPTLVSPQFNVLSLPDPINQENLTAKRKRLRKLLMIYYEGKAHTTSTDSDRTQY